MIFRLFNEVLIKKIQINLQVLEFYSFRGCSPLFMLVVNKQTHVISISIKNIKRCAYAQLILNYFIDHQN